MGNTSDKAKPFSNSPEEIRNDVGILASSSIKRVVWHDPNVNNDENLAYFQKNFANVELERFTDYEGTADFLRKTLGTWMVITAGKNGSKLIPLIHDFTNISGIIIFCRNKEFHEEWSRKFRKVRKVVTHIREVQKELTSIFDREIINGALKFGNAEAIGEIQKAFNHVIYGGQEEELDSEDCVFLHSDSNQNMQFAAIAKIFSKQCALQPEYVLEELVRLNPDKEDIITQEFNLRKDEDLLKAIIYLYSTDHLYKQFNRTFAAQRFQDLAYTLAVCLKELEARPTLAAQKLALYRGIKNINHADKYIVNEILFGLHLQALAKVIQWLKYSLEIKA